MEPAIDLSQLPAGVQRILDDKAPPAMRMMAARGIAPGLKPADALTVVCVLAESADAAVADVAKKTVAALPLPLLNGALAGDLPSGVLDAIALSFASQAEIAERILAHKSVLAATVARMAAVSSEAVSELIATNEQRMLEHPEIIERLYLNKQTRMSTADRIIELAVRNKLELTGIPAYREAAAAIANELIPEASPDPTPDDLMVQGCLAEEEALRELDEDTHEVNEKTGQEESKKKFDPLKDQWGNLSITAKIRVAQMGRGAVLLLALRDPNPLVSGAAAKAPGLTDREVLRASAARNVSEDVLRIFARSPEWSKNYQVKLNLTSNPRTPIAFSMRFLTHLHDQDLKRLGKSREVPAAIKTAASQLYIKRQAKGGG